MCVNRVYNTVLHTITCKQFNTTNIRTVAVINPDEGLVFTENESSHRESRISQRQIMVKTHDESEKCK